MSIRISQAPEVMYLLPTITYEGLYRKRRISFVWLQWAVELEWRI